MGEKRGSEIKAVETYITSVDAAINLLRSGVNIYKKDPKKLATYEDSLIHLKSVRATLEGYRSDLNSGKPPSEKLQRSLREACELAAADLKGINEGLSESIGKIAINIIGSETKPSYGGMLESIMSKKDESEAYRFVKGIVASGGVSVNEGGASMEKVSISERAKLIDMAASYAEQHGEKNGPKIISEAMKMLEPTGHKGKVSTYRYAGGKPVVIVR